MWVLLCVCSFLDSAGAAHSTQHSKVQHSAFVLCCKASGITWHVDGRLK